jgi:hypothetical protein
MIEPTGRKQERLVAEKLPASFLLPCDSMELVKIGIRGFLPLPMDNASTYSQRFVLSGFEERV